MTAPPSHHPNPDPPADAAEHVPLLPPPTYAQVNGPALGLLAAAAPIGALALFAFVAPNAAYWGVALGWGLAMLDTAITGWFLRRATEQMEGSAARVRRGGEIHVLAISFLLRLVVLTLGTIAIQTRAAGQVDPLAFLLSYILLHFVAIGGWGYFLQRRVVRRQEAKALRTAAHPPPPPA